MEQDLEWQLSEKNNEIAAAHQRLTLVEERQTTELTSMSETLQVGKITHYHFYFQKDAHSLGR